MEEHYAVTSATSCAIRVRSSDELEAKGKSERITMVVGSMLNEIG